MTRRIRVVLRSGAVGAVLFASVLLLAEIATAQTYDVLHTFPSCSYNVNLFSSLIEGADGNFYGTTNVSSGLGGTVYRITPAGDVTVLHTFVGGPTDGSNPKAPLVLASDGNFYGTTLHGGGAGAGNGGTLFRMTPAGVVTIMHGFAGGSVDGWNPTRLIQASDGNLYGVTSFGGANNKGTVFRMSLGGAFALVYSFAGGSDNGSGPTTLLEAHDGTFYGMTSGGGVTGNGTVFRTTWDGQTTFLYGSFPGVFQFGSRFSGGRPGGDLMQATDGNFYGTINDYSSPLPEAGSIFQITPDGEFFRLAFVPGDKVSGLIQASDGNLYALAFRNADVGAEPYPRSFIKVTLGGSMSTIHDFTENSCRSPSDAMLHGSDGKFYGTTGAGVVYQLSIPLTISPLTRAIVTGRTTTFTADTVSVPGASFQWQVSTDSGASFTDVADTSEYSGATSSSLSITPATTALNGYLFRVIATNTESTETSNTATLIVRRRGIATDRDGDGQSDLVVFRPGSTYINWFVRLSESGYTTTRHDWVGTNGDVPVAGDYDADGLMDAAVFRPSDTMWYVQKTTESCCVAWGFHFGITGDLPVPGDYDGDGQTDIAVFRPSTGVWFVATSSSNYASFVAYALGVGRDIPVPADYDGDGATDVAVYRPSTGMWFVRKSGSSTALAMQWGLTGDVPVPGDYDGDGQADLALYRPDSGVWYVRLSSTDFSTFTTTQWGLNSDTPVPGDYDDDGKIDPAVYRPSNSMWYILQSSTNYSTSASYQWGVAGDVPVLNAPVAYALATMASRPTTSPQVNLARTSDFDRDGRADVTVFRPSTGTWFTLYSPTNLGASVAIEWGLSTDHPMPGDYDGDGTTDRVAYVPDTGTWKILRSSTNFSTSTTVQWGLNGDVPVSGDYDGDAKTDPAVYRPWSGIWYILQSSTNYGSSLELLWGLSGDVPVPGDYDGDGLTDPAVYRPSTGEWFFTRSRTNYTASDTYQWGLFGDITVPGDYDGDGKTDLAVYRPSTGVWFIRQSTTGYATSTSFQWGLTNDIPAPADFDGDGKTDLAVWRPSTGEWYLLKSSTNFTAFDQVQWGLPGDIPILRRQ